MAQFRTTADIMDLALTNGGEVTSGTSSYETQLLNYLNRVHFVLICGGTIPLGKDKSITIDEVWPWSRAKKPLILELQPKYATGTVTFTQGSEAGTFSSAPSYSVQGWHIHIVGKEEYYKIATHTAGATAFEIDGAYPDDTGSGLSFEVVKLDYELIPDYIVIDNDNNKIQFQETAGTTLTGTLTNGVYTPSDLCTHLASVMDSTGGTPVYTVTYSAVTRLFTIASDRGGSSVFVLVGNGSLSKYSVHKTLGFDDAVTTNAASVTSTYMLGGIARLIEPFKKNKGTSLDGSIYGTDSESSQRNYPLPLVTEGYPDRFTVIKETEDGTFTVRFNRYPTYKTRIEVEHVPIPRDLKDDAASVPLVPRKHCDVLEDAATFFLLLNKNDDRAQTYAALVQGKLEAMVSQHRGSLERTGQNFGKMVPRLDNLVQGKRRLRYGEKS